MQQFEALVVGGGHNGLVCAGYLAQAGLRVAVLERRAALGGPAGTREFMPGYFSSVTNSPGSLEPKIVQDMELERFGLQMVKPDPTLVHPLPDGRLFVGWRERSKTDRQLEAFAPGESGRYHDLFAYLQWFAERLGISLFREPPSLKELVRNLDSLEEQEAFSRVFFGSVRSLFEQFDWAEETQAIMGPLSVVSGVVGPSSAGTPCNLMMRPLSLASLPSEQDFDPRRMPLRGSTGLPVGGMGAIIEAMERCLVARGVSIFREAPVTRIICEKGTVTGVELADGRVFRAPIVVSAMHPHLTVRAVDDDQADWTELKRKISRRSLRGTSFKIVLALGDLPRYAAAGSDEEARQLVATQFRIAPTLQYLEEAFADMVCGRVARQPLIWGLCHTVTSPALAPAGKHLLSLNLGSVPYQLRAAEQEVDKADLVRRVIGLIAEWIPNLPGIVENYACIDPWEFEESYGLVEANLTHGDMLPFNQFWMRPMPGLHRYRTPTRGLYLSGVGTWPGNYFSGIPGHNSGHAVLSDLKAGVLAAPGHDRVSLAMTERG